MGVKKSLTRSSSVTALTLDSFGYTAIHYSSQNNHVKILEFLLTTCKGSNIDTNGCGATPLHRASYSGSVECCKLLLNFGCDVNAFDESFGDRRTALHKSCSRCRNENDCFQQIISLLKQYNADETLLDSQGKLASELLLYNKSNDDNTIKVTNSNESKITTQVTNSNESKTMTIPPKLKSSGPICTICKERKLSFYKRSDSKFICTDCGIKIL